MRSPAYYRMLSNEELLLHGKEALTYTGEFVVALIERYEETLQDDVEELECRIADLEQEVVAMAAQIKEQET